MPHFSELEDWTPAANIYALLKTKSRNTYNKDRNPRPRITVHNISSREHGSKSIRNKGQVEPSSDNKDNNQSTASHGPPDTQKDSNACRESTLQGDKMSGITGCDQNVSFT